MDTLFVYAPFGRENSGDRGARWGAPTRRPLVITMFVRYALFLTLILMPIDVFKLVLKMLSEIDSLNAGFLKI